MALKNVSIRFVAKGLRQRGANLYAANLRGGFYSLCREGSSSTWKYADGTVAFTFLFALSRRVFVNRSSLDGQLTSPVGVTIHTRLRGRICRYRVPVKSKHRGLSASCTPDLGSLVSRTPPAGATGSGGFAANQAAH